MRGDLLIEWLGTLAVLAAPSDTVRVPLCPSLTIVTAIDRPEGDYESIKTLVAIGDRELTLAYSAQVPTERGSLRHWNIRRTVLREDLGTATLYPHYFNCKGPLMIPGSTALGVSTAVLRSLKRTGAAELGIIAAGNSGYPGDHHHPTSTTTRRPGAAARRHRHGAGTRQGERHNGELPAIQARGSNLGEKAEFLFLDDEENPLALQYRFASARPARARRGSCGWCRISYRCAGPPARRARSGSPGSSAQLREQRRAVVYDLYFDFNSDVIREESEPTLREIAEVLRRNPDWTLSIEGHTDNVASDRYNLELSARRAAAVKTALGARFGIAGARLTTAGFGESRPQDRNDTVEGRARNRRVELVRQ